MGARPSSFKRGGGFLDGVDGVISGYKFTDEFIGTPYEAKKIPDFNDPKKKIDAPHNLYFELAVRVDGADEDTIKPLRVGNFDDWEISDDEQEITPVEASTGIAGGSAFGKFLESLITPTGGGDGFPEDRLPEEEFRWSAIIGTRIRLAQQLRTGFGAGKTLNKKTGKSFDRKDLVIETVYELPAEKSAGKGAKTVTKAAGGKPNGKAVEVEVNVAEIAEAALRRYLDATKDNSIAKSKVRMKVLTDSTFKNQNELRDDIVKWLFSDDNLEGLDGVTYDKSDKNQIISLGD